MLRAAVVVASAIALSVPAPVWSSTDAPKDAQEERQEVPQPAPPGPAERPSDTSSEELADVTALLEAMGVRDMMRLQAEQMRQVTAGLVRPQPPPELLEELLKERFFDDILAEAVQCYGRHFTHAQIRELLAFWHSPMGQVVRQKQPIIAREMALIGEEIGRKRAEEMLRKLQERGYKRVAE
jgi:uncharacterized protein